MTTPVHREEAHALCCEQRIPCIVRFTDDAIIHEPACNAIAEALARRDATSRSEGRAEGLREALEEVRRVARELSALAAQHPRGSEERIRIGRRASEWADATVRIKRMVDAASQAGTADRYQEGLRRAAELVAEVAVMACADITQVCAAAAEPYFALAYQRIRAELPADAPPRTKGQP